MFDSKAMVEHSEEQPASEAAMMASIMVGRASSSGSSGSGGGNPPKTVSQSLCRRINDRWYCAKELKIARLALVLTMLASVPFGWAHISSCVEILSIGGMSSTRLP